MLKIGTVISGNALSIQYGPKFEPSIVAEPASAEAGDRDPRIQVCLGHADLRVCRDQPLLGLPDVRPARQQVQRQPGRQGRCGHLLFERPSARDRSGVAPKQDVDAVLGLLDLALDRGDGLRCGVVKRLGLPQVENAGHATVEPGLHQVDRLRARIHRARRDLERQVQRAQRQVGLAEVGDQGRHDRIARVLGGEQVGQSRFGVALEPAPEVDFPGSAESDLRQEAVVGGAGRQVVRSPVADVGSAEGAADRRVGQRAGHRDLGPGLQDALRGHAQVVVLLQRGADQGLQFRIRKHAPPVQRAEGLGAGGRRRDIRAAIDRRQPGVGPLIVRAERRAAGGDAGDGAEQECLSGAHLNWLLALRAQPAASPSPSFCGRDFRRRCSCRE